MNPYEVREGRCVIPGHLEIDLKRGVIYFHVDSEEGIVKMGQVTVLRICQLPPIPNMDEPLDITHMHGVSWAKNDSESK